MYRDTVRILSSFAFLMILIAADVMAAGGTIVGKVTFEGRPRRNPLINMGADPNCLTINAGKKTIQEYVALKPDKSVGNVFVHVTGEVAYSGGAPAEVVLVDQQGCIYHPRVSGAVTGQKLTIKNSDATLHNIPHPVRRGQFLQCRPAQSRPDLRAHLARRRSHAAPQMRRP